MNKINNSRTLKKIELDNPPKFEDLIYVKVSKKVNKFYENKQGDLQKIFTLLLIMFFVYTLFLSVLPGNENVLCSVSAINDCVGSNDGDGSEALCTAYGNCNPVGGSHWNIGGENPSG